MPSAAIVGAGPGLGLEIARVFGTQGFSVALVARTQSKLDQLAQTLTSEGIQAHGFAADITNRASLAAAFAEHQGRIRRRRRLRVLAGRPRPRHDRRARRGAR